MYEVSISGTYGNNKFVLCRSTISYIKVIEKEMQEHINRHHGVIIKVEEVVDYETAQIDGLEWRFDKHVHNDWIAVGEIQ